MPLELFLSTRQTTKIRNAFENNISTDIKLSKIQISKILTNIAIPLTKDNLPGLVSNLTPNALNKFERKKVEKELWEQEKDLLYLFQMRIWMILLKS